MKLLKEELRKQRERIKNMNQQPLQVPVSESQTSPEVDEITRYTDCLLYTSPSPRDATLSRMPSSA